MCTTVITTDVCAHCGAYIAESSSDTDCGLPKRGVLTEQNQNTDLFCDGYEVEHETLEAECYNCLMDAQDEDDE